MSERLSNSPESEKKSVELENSASEQNDRLKENRERAAEQVENKNETEKARENLEKINEDHDKETRRHEKELAQTKEKAPQQQSPTDKGRAAAFKNEMTDARRSMSAPSRAFSKLIHNKAVEKTSEAAGATIARPNALLAGSATALLLTGALYIWARYVGYPLSGFETIGAFIIGWLIGIIFDFTRIMVTGKSS